MSIDGLPPLREVIERHGLQAKKSLGQNFLLDLNLTGKIARAAGDLSQTTVIEVGPGPGGLTRALLMHGARRVVAIERDERCLAALAEIAAHYPGRLEIISGDALKTDFAALAGDGPTRIVANLPYNIGTELLVRWLTVPSWPPFYSSMTLMFQREVAERIVARPATDSYGRLGVLAGWRTEAKIAFDVPPQAFTPPPKVTSSVVHLVPRTNAPARRREEARPRHRSRVRTAPQDAAAEPEKPRRRAPARSGRHRRHAPGGDALRRGVRQAGECGVRQ